MPSFTFADRDGDALSETFALPCIVLFLVSMIDYRFSQQTLEKHFANQTPDVYIQSMWSCSSQRSMIGILLLVLVKRRIRRRHRQVNSINCEHVETRRGTPRLNYSHFHRELSDQHHSRPSETERWTWQEYREQDELTQRNWSVVSAKIRARGMVGVESWSIAKVFVASVQVWRIPPLWWSAVIRQEWSVRIF